jgi:molecular chaperone GrpE (heat shock protein)
MNETPLAQDDLFWLLQGVNFSAELAERDRAHANEVRRVLLGFLEVLDAIDRAVDKKETIGTLAVVRKQFLAAFERAGVHFMDTIGQPFDPLRHRALEARTGDQEHPVIVEEITRGCDWNGELLRPAGVVIAQSG